jgi:hypothetical protein
MGATSHHRRGAAHAASPYLLLSSFATTLTLDEPVDDVIPIRPATAATNGQAFTVLMRSDALLLAIDRARAAFANTNLPLTKRGNALLIAD